MRLRQETAVNIGFACSLLRTDMALYRVSAETPEVTRLEDAGRAKEVAASSATTVHCSLILCMGTLDRCALHVF